MALVEYSDSDDEEIDKKQEASADQNASATKKSSLPPLPTMFHDLYSSTVRTSTQDDPSLHGGRKRIKPHVDGNWPTHVYLEWHPSQEEVTRLQSLLFSGTAGAEIHSLLTNSLSVSLPLHISLSRPLILKTEQKDLFLLRIREAVSQSQARKFECKAKDLRWHPNEFQTRWFLVLVVEEAEGGAELGRLLKGCNDVAREMGLEVLYEEDGAGGTGQGKFHISLAWSLTESKGTEKPESDLRETLSSIPFEEVKVRIGQDVSIVRLPEKRRHRQG